MKRWRSLYKSAKPQGIENAPFLWNSNVYINPIEWMIGGLQDVLELALHNSSLTLPWAWGLVERQELLQRTLSKDTGWNTPAIKNLCIVSAHWYTFSSIAIFHHHTRYYIISLKDFLKGCSVTFFYEHKSWHYLHQHTE